MKKLLTVSLIFILSSIFAQSKFSAKVFFDYSYQKDKTPTNSFEIHRAYFTFKNNLTKNISYKFTTDVGRFNTGKDTRLSVYLKNALIKWKSEFGTFVFGLQGLNVFSVQEKNWGYRFIEKSAMDKNKFASSADLGIGYSNKIGKKLNISLIVSNGTGYKKAENDNYKKISAQVYYGSSKLNDKNSFNLGAVFSNESFDYSNGLATTTEAKTLLGLFGAVRLNKFKIGAEFDSYKTGGANITATIISAYTNISLTKKADAFARVDLFDPNTDADNDGNTYFVAGFNLKPAKGLFIAPNIRVTKPQTGDSVTEYKLSFQFKL